MEIPEIRADETAEVARSKVLYAYERIAQPTVALDAGFYIPSLGGFPKVYANFVVGTIGLEGLLTLVAGKDRRCEFRNSMAYIDSELEESIFFHSTTRSTLADAPCGTVQPFHWSTLHLIVIPEGETKTLAEMSETDIDAWRSRQPDEWCGRQFARWLQENRL